MTSLQCGFGLGGDALPRRFDGRAPEADAPLLLVGPAALTAQVAR